METLQLARIVPRPSSYNQFIYVEINKKYLD